MTHRLSARPSRGSRSLSRRYPAVLGAALGLLAAGWLAGCSAPAPDGDAGDTATAHAEYSIEDFLATTRIRGASFSPDRSKILISSDQSGIFNAYAVAAADGAMTQLTDLTETVQTISYFPHDERFLYNADQGGNELDHLYVKEMDGSTVDLTPGEQLKAFFGGWADDERSFFVLTNERDQRYFDVYEVTVDGYQRQPFYQDEEGLQFGGVSPDKRTIAFTRPNTRQDSDVLLYDRDSGQTRVLTTHEGDVVNDFADFSPAGDAVYYTTDAGSEFLYLMRQDLATGASREVVRTDWDVAFADFSRDGHYLVVGINNDAVTELRLYRVSAGDEAAGGGEQLTQVELPAMGSLNIVNVILAPDSSQMAFYAASSRSPNDLYLYGLDGSAPRQLTRSLNPAIDPQQLVEAEVVRFASFDGVEIPGLLYRPIQASATAKVPALVWVHGGPGGQSRVGYDPLQQYLINHGYAIFAINNRGSGGYGKTFSELDDRAHGAGDLDDCVTSKQMLIDTGWVDPAKIGILGGSYGGYMVAAALAFRPEEFDVGVNLFGVTNWLRTLRSIPPWWEAARKSLYKEMGDPDKDEEYLRSISPLFHAENIQRPLLVLQGANDPRVLQVESDEIVEKVRANGVPVVYEIFDDEGHGFNRKINREAGYRKILEFLDQYLKGEAPAGADASGQEADEAKEAA